MAERALVGPAMMVDTLWHDLVFAMRLLRKSPVFAATVVLTLGLGVSVNTAVFSVVNAIVLRPLPVRDSDRLVVIASQNTSTRLLRGISFPDLEDYRTATNDVFEDIAAYSVGFLGLAPRGGRQPERVLVTWVTGNYFRLLDVRPILGRVVRPDEGGRGHADAVAVLGHSAWQRKFGGDPSVVGEIVRVNGRPCTIVGVLPPEFVGTFAFSDSELYLPLNWSGTADFDDRQTRGFHALARLRPGVTVESAQTAVNVAADRLAREYPDTNGNVTIRVLPERFARPEEDQFRSNVLTAAIMLALVVLVMAVAAVNVTNLLLARATARHQEFAIRAALGAGRGRLVRQLVTETLMLTALGGGAGLFSERGRPRRSPRCACRGICPSDSTSISTAESSCTPSPSPWSPECWLASFQPCGSQVWIWRGRSANHDRDGWARTGIALAVSW